MKKEFKDDEGTVFTVEEHWDMHWVGAWVEINKPPHYFVEKDGKYILMLLPDVAKSFAQELVKIAESIERKRDEHSQWTGH
jgi:hypothetical protein